MDIYHTDPALILSRVYTATTVKEQRKAAKTLHLTSVLVAKYALLLDAGAVEVLASALGEWADAKAKEHCVRAVYWFVRHREKTAAAFAKAGVVESLAAFVPHVSATGTSTAAWALLALAKVHPAAKQRLRDVPGFSASLDEFGGSDLAQVIPELRQMISQPTPSETAAVTASALGLAE